MFNPFSLEGKRILVTGASSGIGRGIALACSQMGAQVVLNGRNQQRLEETLSMLEGEGHVIAIADLSDRDGVDSLANQVTSLDGFVFSSGVLDICTLKTITQETLGQMMSINAYAPILLTSSLVKKKKLGKGASCVYVSSLSGVVIGGTGELAYSATKGALSGFVKTAALEMASKMIRVNAVCPAIVPTELSKKYHEIVPEEVLVAEIPNKYPLKRMGTPEDVANAVVYLLSDASSWVTGINLIIDGGLTLK